MTSLLIRRARISGHGEVDVRVRGGRIAELAKRLDENAGEAALDAAGGELLPGLNDHHVHLLALAAAQRSLRCGPPEVRDAADLARTLMAASAESAQAGDEAWLRGVGYHESVAGELDRWRLDRWLPDRPVRIQHRSGALWVLNSAAIRALGLEQRSVPPGVLRDGRDRIDGRLFRLDGWLRAQLGAAPPPDLGAVGRLFARLGVTGLCDATAHNDASELAHLERAVARRELPQRLRVMGTHSLPRCADSRVARGQVKLMLDDAQLPAPEALAAEIERAHAAERGVAIHCVTRGELVLAASGLAAAGARTGDRIEHAGVAPPDLLALLVALGVTVVTQPSFLYERGDAYLADVEARDQPWLYRGRGFLDAGLRLAAGSDAPFGAADPWAAMRAAVDRRTAAGARIGADEALSPEQALALFSSPLEAPGTRSPTLAVGSPADLCLLDRPWAQQRGELGGDAVLATLVAGELIWRRDQPAGDSALLRAAAVAHPSAPPPDSRSPRTGSGR